MIELNNFSLSFGKKNILSNINLVIEKGDNIGIIGPSGSGKTSLIKSILGVYGDQGRIIINKTYSKNISVSSRSTMISYMSQFFNPSSSLQVKDFVSLSRMIMRKGKCTPVFEEEIYLKMKEKRVDILSGGERQLVQLLGVIHQSTKVNLLDEPTSSLDPFYIKAFVELFYKYLNNNTNVIVSHDINLICRLCSKIVGIKDGQITFIKDRDSFQKDLSFLEELFSIKFEKIKNNIFPKIYG